MKSKEELKKELHKLIESIDDEETLNILNEDVIPYTIENKKSVADVEDDLTDEQWNEVQQSIKEAKEGKVMPVEEFYNRMEQWRTK